MGSKGHYVSGGGRGTRPGRVVAVVVQPVFRDLSSVEGRGAPLRFHRAAVAEVIWRRDRWSPITHTSFTRATSCLEYIHSLGRPHQTVHVVSPSAGDSLTLLRYWEWLDEVGARWAWGEAPAENPDAEPLPPPQVLVRRMVLSGPPDIVDYYYRGCSYRWVSGANYYRMPEDEVAKAVGFIWPGSVQNANYDPIRWHPPEERAELWCRAVMSLADWWAPLGAGRWPVSIPSAAFSYLRSRIPKRMVCTHTDERVIPLERQACHGGRSTCWYYGDVRPDVGTSWAHPQLPGRSPWGEMAGPVYHWDVRSMYPALMRDQLFPVRLSHYQATHPVQEMAELLTAFEAVARVDIRSELPEYPHRHAGRIVYPVGRYTATLAGQELRQAVAEGSVIGVHEAAYYWRGRPFKRAADELLEMRSEAERQGRADWAMLLKLVGNSVTGKMAQRRGQWVPVPERAPLMRWGEWIDGVAGGGPCEKWRAVAGLCWRWDDAQRGTGTLTAAYACLTAAGRMQMRRIREQLPERSVIAQATDGLWVTSSADRALCSRGAVGPSPAGTLRPVGECSIGRWLDATHYIHDGCWVLAGFAGAPPSGGGLVVTDAQMLNPVRVACSSPPNILWERYRESSLMETIREGGITPDGWLTPYRLPGRGPSQPGETV